jgi:UDP-N-acetylmuramate: L-alanyl-gamma-D-glutamyl-meso-diaminopimelate ligase
MVVVGNAISRGNPELEHLLNERLPYTSAAAVIKEEFLRGRVVAAVAGTHGKTSTTSLLAWVLEEAGFNPSFLIGGVAENFGTSFRLADSDFFVIEADEYDTAYFDKGPKMWHYLPWVGVVTNIEFDHADIYRDDVAYNYAFERFINLVPGRGRLIAGWDSPMVRKLSGKSPAPVESFGFAEATSEGGEAPRWTATGVAYGERTRYTVQRDGAPWGHVDTALAGAFNVRNALAVIAAATALGADPERVRAGLASFRSVRRRLEERGTVKGVTVIDDFAHHPTAVRETLAAARQKYAGRRLLAVFEPRSYTAQRREFQDAYAEALSTADAVVLAGLFHPERYDENTGMNPHELIAACQARGVPAYHTADVGEIVARTAADARTGDVVMIMSNGGFGGIHERLLSALASA